MADQANIVGKVTVDTSDAVRSVGDLKRSVDGAGRGFGSFAAGATSAMDKAAIGLAKFNLALGGIQEAMRMAGAAWDAALFAGKMRQAKEQIKSLGVSIDVLSAAAGGTVNNMTLMEFALKQLRGESRLTQHQLDLVLRASDNLSDQFAGEQMQIMEDLALAIKGGPTEALIKYGFQIDKTLKGQERINDIMRQTESIASATVIIDEQGKALQRVAKGWGDFWDAFKAGAGSAVGGAVSGTMGVLDARTAAVNAEAEWLALKARKLSQMFGEGYGNQATAVDDAIYVPGVYERGQRMKAEAEKKRLEFSLSGGVADASTAAAKWVNDFAANVAYEFEKGSAVAERRRAAKAASGAGHYEHEYAQLVSWGDLSDERRQGDLDALIEGAMPRNSVFAREYQGALANTAEMNKVTGSAVADLLRASDLIKQNEQMREANEHLEAMNNWMIVGTPAAVAFADALMSGGNAFQALAKGLQQGLRALAIDSGVKALYALGEGLLFGKPGAYAAASKYTAAAVAAGVGSAAIGSLVGSGGGGSASPSVSSAGASIGGGSSSTGGNAPIIVNVSGVIGPPQEMGRIITNAINEAQRTGRARARDASRWS